jgi:hypothetical protein
MGQTISSVRVLISLTKRKKATSALENDDEPTKWGKATGQRAKTTINQQKWGKATGRRAKTTIKQQNGTTPAAQQSTNQPKKTERCVLVWHRAGITQTNNQPNKTLKNAENHCDIHFAPANNQPTGWGKTTKRGA